MKGISKAGDKMTGSTLDIGHDAEKQAKRDKLDLILELLIASFEPVKKTHLLYRTKINHAQLSRYLRLVLDLGMLEEISDPFEGYVITKNGRITLELFAKLGQKRVSGNDKEISSGRLMHHYMVTG